MYMKFEVTSPSGAKHISDTLEAAKSMGSLLFSQIDHWSDNLDEDGICYSYDRYGYEYTIRIVAVEHSTFWVVFRMVGDCVWKDMMGKPMEFISEIQADEMAEIWKEKYAGSSIPHSVIVARSVPIN